MEENTELTAFIGQLAELNRELVEIFHTGNAGLFTDLNRTIKEMYRLQHGKEDDAFMTIGPDCEVIYRNFDMLVAVLRTTENGEIDRGAQTAVNKFLHNITDAACNIAAIFGLV